MRVLFGAINLLKLKNLIGIFLLGFAINLLICKPSFAIDPNALKVSFIYKFGSYIRWPEETFNSDHESFEICLAWNNFFIPAKAFLEQQKVQDRSVIVRKITPSDDLNSCQIVYISSSDESFNNKKVMLNTTSAVLTISDHKDFASDIGMIGLLTHNNKLAFEINLTLVKSKNIYISAPLVNLAKKLY